MAASRTWTSGLGSRPSDTVAAAGKLQLMGSSPLQKSASMTQGGFFRRNTGLKSMTFGTGGSTASSAAARRSQSASALEVAEVRALAGDAPIKGDGVATDMPPKNSHEALLHRLKSRAARLEAEKNRDFIAKYRIFVGSVEDSIQQDNHLDAILKALDKRTCELKERSDELQLEAQEAEHKLEYTNSLSQGRATETELQNLNPFERSQRRIAEDKKEEEFQKMLDEVRAQYAKVHRRLTSELIELRDYKVLLRDYRRVRLEKLGETLHTVQDGRRLRNCVRVMIRNGAQRILARLEAANLPLEAWMREVLVNCCHVEIRLEDAEAKLLGLRKQALQPIKTNVQEMISRTKSERFESLLTRTWEQRQQKLGLAGGIVADGAAADGDGTLTGWPAEPAAMGTMGSTKESTGRRGGDSTVSFQPGSTMSSEMASSTIRFTAAPVAEKVIADLRALEEEIACLRRLLADMRHNAAAVICNQIRQADKGGNKQAMLWGQNMLSLLVSEDFAKTTMKELQKLAPTAKMTH
eukprot:TRINITY_DN61242_c0_g1_i1.p1 TRINITY_DN61242_c0_g1~~TRINITY_DN61242_c0_g1_i1.p1  ORF type:complete len:556 (+),score=125.60 TRINITY_DN61242_c0_g1_i1:99-1670(+)